MMLGVVTVEVPHPMFLALSSKFTWLRRWRTFPSMLRVSRSLILDASRVPLTDSIFSFHRAPRPAILVCQTT